MRVYLCSYIIYMMTLWPDLDEEERKWVFQRLNVYCIVVARGWPAVTAVQRQLPTSSSSRRGSSCRLQRRLDAPEGTTKSYSSRNNNNSSSSRLKSRDNSRGGTTKGDGEAEFPVTRLLLLNLNIF